MCALFALKTSISQCHGKYQWHKQYQLNDEGSQCHSNQSINVLFYVCSYRGDIRQQQQTKNTNTPKTIFYK